QTRQLVQRALIAGRAAIGVALWVNAAAANQTDTFTPIQINGGLPYRISLQPYDFGARDLPTLHSFAAGNHDGKWVLVAGKSNGLHGFEMAGPNGFEPEFQNREVWVIDPVNRQSWHRSLDGAGGGLTTTELNSLTPANNQYYQRGQRLYMTGGYGVQTILGGNPINGTFDRLSAIDLPGIVDWVMTGNGIAKDHIRQINSPSFRVTGGAMYEMGGRTHLVFGQDFSGNYNPNKNGSYTNQVRSFTIADDGTALSISNSTSTAADPNYRRRDLNVFPVMVPGVAGTLDEGLVVLSGVFTPPPTIGAWTVPVEIDSSGNPSMADPNDPATFKQGFNNYHSAKLGLFSESQGEMHEVLFGGISLQYLNTDTRETETDHDLPFINDITSVVIDAAGNYRQHWLGEFPAINDLEGKRLRFGANAEFFLAHGIETFANGVIKLDELSGPTTLGYIYGGIIANGPHTRSGDPPATSSASNIIFTVVYTPVPEPASAVLAVVALCALGSCRFAHSRARVLKRARWL
ncbi:MAG TPA: hypothetical protein VGK58_16150, partial [Lacipirellulaceae bacterium]